MNTVHSALGSLRSFFGLCGVLSEIEAEWRELAGSALARRSAVKSFDDGVLVVVVENRSAQQDMNFKKNAIIRAISMKTSLRLKDIRVEVAPVNHALKPRRHKNAPRNRRAFSADAPGLDAMKSDILSANPGIGEKLAEVIASCRLGRQSAVDK